MQRTQISLTDDERRLLDAQSQRTGKSIAALIREAVQLAYGQEHTLERDLAAMRKARGAWKDRDFDGAEFVDRIRSGGRLKDAYERFRR